MHIASLKSSKRLQSVYFVLRTAKSWYSVGEIRRRTEYLLGCKPVEDVRTAICELTRNGVNIESKKRAGFRYHEYRIAE